MVYQITYTSQAAKEFRHLPTPTAKLVRSKLDQIAIDPYAPHPNVTKLQGRSGFRLRIGDWRVIYELRNTEMLMLIIKIAPRGEVYR